MKIAIAGYGLEGESNYRYFTNSAENEIVIVDEKQPQLVLPEGVKTIIGDNAFSQLADFDMVVRTAGLSPHKIVTNGKIWSATNEFFEKCPAPIIGVTGSKGKGTTASLIASILKEAGYNVHLVGNIGVPALDVLTSVTASDIVVYELSSFQLWDIERSPQTAVVLYIESEHLDVHANLEEYLAAKSNIVKYQAENDVVVYNQANDYAARIGEASRGKKVPYQNELYAHVQDDNFYYGEQKLCSTSQLTLPGKHNLDNACAAINAVWALVGDGEIISQGISKFKGLDHRLKFVATVNDVDYYDDSIATTPGSAIAAIASFEKPKILILGGSSKGADFTELASRIMESNVRGIILIGEEADNIEQSLKNVGFSATYNLGSDTDMPSIVGKSVELAKQGDIVILSPACASFGMFKNYADRGDQFISAIKNL